MPDENSRYGVYFLADALLFWFLASIALRRLIAATTRPRLAILAFAVSFGMFLTQNATIRLGVMETSLAHGWHSEAIRIACTASLAWIVWEYGRGRIVTRHP